MYFIFFDFESYYALSIFYKKSRGRLANKNKVTLAHYHLYLNYSPHFQYYIIRTQLSVPMKTSHKYHTKTTDTSLETDIDDSSSLYTPWTYSHPLLKKKRKRRTFKKYHHKLTHTVTHTLSRKSSGSNLSISPKLWEFPATSKNTWICPSASPKNSKKWYFLLNSGSRQRYWVRSLTRGRVNRPLLLMAERGNQSQQELLILKWMRPRHSLICAYYSHSITIYHILHNIAHKKLDLQHF